MKLSFALLALVSAGPHIRGTDCENKCYTYSQESFKKCVNEGGSEEKCKYLMKEQYNSCVEKSCKDSPKAVRMAEKMAKKFARGLARGTACENKCYSYSQESYKKCINDGGSEDKCDAPKAVVFESKNDRCDAYCTDYAQQAMRRCMAVEGATEERCANYARGEYASCSERCNAQVSVFGPCEDRCDAAKDDHLKRCETLETEEEQERCRRHAGQNHRECLSNCSGGGPEPDCKTRCEQRHHEEMRKCQTLEDAQEQERCAHQAQQNFHKCMEENCQRPE
ncbi:Oidioi.mRNA.OKI2018_I69.chr2.g6959.t1.cds [Oikopleura dioica]|uniref:Oidioi.mRNA.OKI2018_I69.chr2.g6959.t1.cds n=1 Tax=Oikopleura dioica TaxID=34765 RepID=A0ABN7TB80_OIKDI|nr:Oidioi.mRNA.OKI2018_I69.chr2.g6959.t1.cds [Oikopleura dioica]